MSPKRLLHRYFGNRELITKAPGSGWLGQRLHDPEIWNLRRNSVAGGVSLGFFLAFIPLPIQMLIAAPIALMLRVNLPVTLASIWITNPITFAPMLLFAYKVGTWLTATDGTVMAAGFNPSIAGARDAFGEIWLPLSVGCLVCGLSAAAIGNVAVRWTWRAYSSYRWRQRRKARVYANAVRSLKGPI